MKIISFSGLISSGKDTAADYLVKNHGYQRISFSAVLKDATHAIFGWDRDVLDGRTPEARAQREVTDQWWSDQLNMEDVSPRTMLQYFGTDIMRDNLHPNIWALALKHRLLGADPESKFVVSDTRFFNELQMMDAMGATVCGIYRNLPKWLDGFYEYVNNYLECTIGQGLMSIDMGSNHEALKAATEAAQGFFPRAGIEGPHQSELQHLLWNRYHTVVDNTKSLAHLYDQVEKLA